MRGKVQCSLLVLTCTCCMHSHIFPGLRIKENVLVGMARMIQVKINPQSIRLDKAIVAEGCQWNEISTLQDEIALYLKAVHIARRSYVKLFLLGLFQVRLQSVLISTLLNSSQYSSQYWCYCRGF